ncbi:MAG TPA: hypothetical protein VJH96_00790 [Patescibacteria group bacterium]|nr:hypothetical protein [Patescibacteria group bacterium]
MKEIQQALASLYARISFFILTITIFVSFMFLNYFLLLRTTTWEKFLQDNPRWFVFASVNLTILNNFLIALAITFFIYLLEKKRSIAVGETSSSLVSTFLSIVSVGCTVCGGFLLPLVGIAASLSALPFYGIEIKVISIVVLLVSLNILIKRTNGILEKPASPVKKYAPLIISLLALVVVYGIPRLPYGVKTKLGERAATSAPSTQVDTAQGASDDIFEEINPSAGYEIASTYRDLGPKLIEMGVIDFEKFKAIYEKNGQPLTQEQLLILTKGLDKKIKITRENSYFLLNFFWAFGLANKSKVLTQGDMTKYGKDQVGNFASTGGWTLAKDNPMNYYAKRAIVPLTATQEQMVAEVSGNIYRPCCNNSTAFPDCNHGMALLGVLELMAADGASEGEMYEAAKYFNAFFFPGNYYDLALYFKNKEGKSFRQVDSKILLGKDYSSASGWQGAKQWLTQKGIVKEPPRQGGGCGV